MASRIGATLICREALVQLTNLRRKAVRGGFPTYGTVTLKANKEWEVTVELLPGALTRSFEQFTTDALGPAVVALHGLTASYHLSNKMYELLEYDSAAECYQEVAMRCCLFYAVSVDRSYFRLEVHG